MRFHNRSIEILILVFFSVVIQLQAQRPVPDEFLAIYPSEKGNLVTVLPKDREMASSEEFLKTTSYFKINRAELLLNNTWTTYKRIGQIKRSKTVSELRAIVTPTGVASLQQFKNLPTEQKVQQFLTNEYHYDSLMAMGFFSPKFLEAFGIAFNDTQAERGVVYSYQIIRVDKSGREETWAESKIVSKIPNPWLNRILILQDSIISSDSIVFFKFHAEFPITQPSKAENFPLYAPINTKLSAKEQRKIAQEQNIAFIEHLNARPIEPSSITFNVFYKENNNNWKLLSRYQTIPDSIGVYRLGAFVRTKPESYIQVRILSETFGSEAAAADSATVYAAYAISETSVPLVYSVSGRDSTDCIIINWDLPSKPYYRGVLVERREGNNELETLDFTGPLTKSYIDYKVKPGIVYTYYVKAMFNPKQSVRQKAASTISLSSTTFSLPLPPYNLRIDTTSKEFPILKWDAVESPSRYGFIVYRGTKPKELSHLGQIVKGTTFVDSLGPFSARVKMYYAVVAQNLTQDSSDFSNIVEFKPKVALDVVPPRYINSKLINGNVFLDWPEMRGKDKLISGYTLESRNEIDTVFKTVGPKLITDNFFIDSTFRRDLYHEYRVAAVADDGQKSPFSMAFDVDFPMERPSGVTSFSLRNTTKGVLVKWPSVALPNTKEFIIYRNDPPKAQLRKLATVPAGNFEYVDTTVSDTGSYLYAMSIVAKDGVESQKSPRKSLKRAKPNKLPTTP